MQVVSVLNVLNNEYEKDHVYWLMVQALGDDSKESIGRTVLRSLVTMEREKPGSCEAFVAKLIELLGRYMKNLKNTDTNTCLVIHLIVDYYLI